MNNIIQMILKLFFICYKYNLLNKLIMRTSTIFIIIFVLVTGKKTNAQDLPDLLHEPASASHYYYPNYGQIIDNSGNVRNDILYYTERTQPAVYLDSSNAYFVISKRINDTSNLDSSIFLKYRIQLNFVSNNSSPIITSSETGSDYLNYYLPHCSGGITDVQSYKRIKYQNAFPKIDFHFYSNLVGLKNYIVVNPEGDPNNILLHFSGQDSINVYNSTQLQLFLTGGYHFILPQPTAYQIDLSNNPVSLSWSPVWVSLGNGNVALLTQSYNHNLPLVICIAGAASNIFEKTSTNLYWSTFYGGNGADNVKSTAFDYADNLFTLGTTNSSVFKTQNGFQPYNKGGTDAYISKFDIGSTRLWATYYGGTLNEQPEKITPEQRYCGIGAIFVGKTNSTNLPMASTNHGNFIQSTYGGGSGDAFIVALDAKGQLYWTTYFGGEGGDIATSIDVYSIDGPNYIIVTGATTSNLQAHTCTSPTTGYFSVCNAKSYGYFQDWKNGSQNAFIAEFTLHGNYELNWSTYFGGENNDIAYDIKHTFDNNNLSNIVICGQTYSKQVPQNISSPTPATHNAFPIADPGGAYVQTHRSSNNDCDGFIAHFNQNRDLVWSTFYGGNATDELHSLATTTKPVFIVGNEFAPSRWTTQRMVYATGITSTNSSHSSCTAINTGAYVGNIPICNSNGVSYIQNTYGGGDQDQLILQFNLNGSLLWSTYYGGVGTEVDWDYTDITDEPLSALAIDNRNNLFVTGNEGPPYQTYPPTSGIHTKALLNAYNQTSNSDPNHQSYDAYILSFNKDNDLKWATYFGGASSSSLTPPSEYIYSCAASSTNILAVAGTSFSSSTPTQSCMSPSSNPYYELTNNGGWDGFITMFDVSSTYLGIKEPVMVKNNELKAYPNPVNDIITIEIPKTESGEFQVKLSDVMGNILFTNTISFRNGGEKMNINTSALPNGFYFINLINNGKSYSCKFVK